MKKLLAMALCLASFSLLGCATGYKNVDSSWTEPATSVTVLFTEPEVQNKDDVEDDLPDYANNFSGWFAEQFASKFNEKTGISAKAEKTDAANFEMVNTKFGKKEFPVPDPKFDQLGNVDGTILSIGNFVVSRVKETKMIVPGSIETKEYLQFMGEYSIANASEKKVLARGMFKSRVTLGFAMGKGDWEENVENLVEEIVKDTPLQKK